MMSFSFNIKSIGQLSVGMRWRHSAATEITLARFKIPISFCSAETHSILFVSCNNLQKTNERPCRVYRNKESLHSKYRQQKYRSGQNSSAWVKQIETKY